MNRLKWIDNIKGFGILLVVLGHIFVCTFNNTYKEYLWFDFLGSWYMEMFFFFSGFVYTYKGGSLIKFTWKSFKSLVYPCLIIFFLGNGIRELLNYWWNGETYHLESLVWFYWFCKCLFVCRIILYIMIRIHTKTNYKLLNEVNQAIILTVILVVLSKYGIEIPCRVKGEFIFYALGYGFRRYGIYLRYGHNSKVLCLSIIGILVGISFRYNILSDLSLPNIITNNLIALPMMVVIYHVFSKYVDKLNILTKWGGQSLLIYLIHIEILNFIVLLNATFWNFQIQHAIVVLLGTFLLTWLSFSISTMIQQHRLSRKFFLLKV